MIPSFLFWIPIVLYIMNVKNVVHCAQCSTHVDCSDTIFTSPKCTNNICDCKYGYAPIRSGCGKKLSTPRVTTEAGKTPDFISGSSATLTCSTVAGATSYAWYLGTTKLSDTTQNITIRHSGVFTCQAISSTASLNSDKSDALTIKDVPGNSPYPGTLTVGTGSSYPKIFPGRAVTLTCYGVPLDYAGKISFLVEGITAPVVESTSLIAKLTMTSVYSGKKISCRLETFMTISFTNSVNIVILPLEDAGIKVDSVAVIVTDPTTGVLNKDTTYNIGADGPIISCLTTPEPEYLDDKSNLTYVVRYAYYQTQQIGPLNTYKVPTAFEMKYPHQCTVKYGTADEVLSDPTKIIIISADFFASPTLAKVNNDELQYGSSLVLSCGFTQLDDVSYTWLMNNQIIEGQGDWEIQLYNFTADDIGEYKCRAVRSRYTPEDSTFVAMMKPAITREPSGSFYTAGSNYVLTCNTGSRETTGWTYSWRKDNTETSIKTNVYTITNAAATTHNGGYTCTAMYKGLSMTGGQLVVGIEVVRPAITREPLGTIFGAGGNYVLRCNSGLTITIGLSYSWTKNAAYTGISTDTYKITAANAALHNGAYTCTVTLRGVSTTSDRLNVTVEAPGKQCTADTDCIGTKYTGKCSTTTPAVCQCALRYKLKGEDCASSAAAINTCILMLLLASLRRIVY